jgi:hypothetical protein
MEEALQRIVEQLQYVQHNYRQKSIEHMQSRFETGLYNIISLRW